MSEELTETTESTTPTDGESPANQAPSKMLTQAEVNRQVEERLARDRDARAKDLGYESWAALEKADKDRKKAEEETREANLSELEKAQGETAAEREAREASDRRADELAATLAERDRRDAFRDAWIAADHPVDRVSAAYKLADWPNEDEPDIDKVIEAVIKANAFLAPEAEPTPLPDTAGARGRVTSGDRTARQAQVNSLAAKSGYSAPTR